MPLPFQFPGFLAACVLPFASIAKGDGPAEGFDRSIRPLLKEFCLDCHSAEEQKGDLDLERFANFEAVRGDAKVWQLVKEQLELGEMPPEKKPQLSTDQKDKLLTWTRSALGDIAKEHAGDSGPVVVRRLSNSEYTYTLRDITGIPSLDPAREFPIDGAAGEGFTNAGAALVMSPGLFAKYFEAAKEVAGHAVLLPKGIAFSEKTTQRDWTEEKLAAIRSLYAQFTEKGGGTSVDLQGIKFDTKDGGVLPLEKYLTATLIDRESLAAGTKTITDVALERGLNAKYLGILWSALNDKSPSHLLEMIREQWREAKPDEAPALVATIGRWQSALWRFTTVGQIGKRDSSKAWQEPVNPLATSQEIRLKLPEADGREIITLYLTTSDAGDGNVGDSVIWERPQLVFQDRPPILLRDAENITKRLEIFMAKELARTGAYLDAIAEAHSAKRPIEEIAEVHKLDPALAAKWAGIVDLGRSSVPVATGHYTEKHADVAGHSFVRSWGSAQTPSLTANASKDPVSFSTLTMPGRSVLMHPSPTLEATLYWRSPIDGKFRAEGLVADADGNCGNGVAWRVELMNSKGTVEIADGVIENGARQPFKSETEFAVEKGDLVKFSVNPRDKNHICDSTIVALTLTQSDGEKRVWDLAEQVADRLLESNPLPDSFGNADVWHFCRSEEGDQIRSIVPPDSALAAWREAVVSEKPKPEIQKATAAVQQFLSNAEPASEAERILRNALLDWGGPVGWMKLVTGASSDGGNIELEAPSALTFRLPAKLAAGAEFVATAKLHPEKGKAGSVQMRATLTEPPTALKLAPGTLKVEGKKSTWTDGVLPVVSDSPVLVAEGGEAQRRITADFDAFREIFPAALCYTKIVPVDEVVTLTLFYREDEYLRRLMLDAAQTAELDRLWEELHFVSEDAFKLVDAYEQLWQFATQDADPSVLDPLREPILERAKTFREKLVSAQPHHLNAVLEFAERAWRRPLTNDEVDGLGSLYRKLRDEELPHENAIRLTIARVLVAPGFLYKLENPKPGEGQAPVSDIELATRLSYFLWSSAPDAELTALSKTGKLSDTDVIVEQTKRMLSDPRVRRLAIEFGSQWLHVRDFDQLDEKSERHFPEFATVRSALNEEPIHFFTDLFKRDGSILDLLDANHTFVDDTLAQYYGLPGEKTGGWRRVDGVREKGRGGVLGFGATLAKQSGASRTSPILRGAWISETLLGERLPRPPKGVPVLPEKPPAGLTERALTEKHSSDPSCARCHARIDPFGFALENYDAVGRFRAKDATGLSIDASARLLDETEFEGIAGLRDYLLNQRREDFVRQFCRKLLGYALGRGVLLSDEPLLDEMQTQLADNGYRVGLAIELIVQSRQFREIRGRDFPSNQ